jgi:hypothetical protein
LNVKFEGLIIAKTSKNFASGGKKGNEFVWHIIETVLQKFNCKSYAKNLIWVKNCVE